MQVHCCHNQWLTAACCVHYKLNYSLTHWLLCRFTQSVQRNPIRPGCQWILEDGDFLRHLEVQVGHVVRDILNDWSICKRRAVRRHARSAVEVRYLLPVNIHRINSSTTSLVVLCYRCTAVKWSFHKPSCKASITDELNIHDSLDIGHGMLLLEIDHIVLPRWYAGCRWRAWFSTDHKTWSYMEKVQKYLIGKGFSLKLKSKMYITDWGSVWYTAATLGQWVAGSKVRQNWSEWAKMDVSVFSERKKKTYTDQRTGWSEPDSLVIKMVYDGWNMLNRRKTRTEWNAAWWWTLIEHRTEQTSHPRRTWCHCLCLSQQDA